VPELTGALEADDKYLRGHAAAALGKIGATARTTVTALTRVLKDKDEDVRGEAAAALGHLGAEARSSVGDLVELLEDEHRAVRRQAATALKLIDPETAARHLGFLPGLRRWLARNRLTKPKG
jgi:HEAT repeat protein